MKSSGVYTTRLMFVPTWVSNGILPNTLPLPFFFFLHFQGPKACWAPGNPGHPDSRSSHHLFLATQPGINPSSVTIVLASETNFKHSTGGGPVKLYMNLLAPGITQHYCQVSDLLHLLHPNHLQGKVDSEIPACSEKTMEAICSGRSKEELELPEARRTLWCTLLILKDTDLSPQSWQPIVYML